MGCDFNWTVLLIGLCIGFVVGFVGRSLLDAAQYEINCHRYLGRDRDE